MKANELRIGNWVDLRGSYLQVFSINNTSTATHSKIELDLDSVTLDKHVKWVNISCIEPIPLTEEILLSCGFLNWNGYFSKGNIKYENGNIILKFYSDDAYIIKGIKYLHQLQNLYYALTGGDLEIEL